MHDKCYAQDEHSVLRGSRGGLSPWLISEQSPCTFSDLLLISLFILIFFFYPSSQRTVWPGGPTFEIRSETKATPAQPHVEDAFILFVHYVHIQVLLLMWVLCPQWCLVDLWHLLSKLWPPQGWVSLSFPNIALPIIGLFCIWAWITTFWL